MLSVEKIMCFDKGHAVGIGRKDCHSDINLESAAMLGPLLINKDRKFGAPLPRAQLDSHERSLFFLSAFKYPLH
jgi:hypothetical protein